MLRGRIFTGVYCAALTRKANKRDSGKKTGRKNKALWSLCKAAEVTSLTSGRARSRDSNGREVSKAGNQIWKLG